MYIGKSPADVLIGPTVSSVDISDETIATIDIAADAITGAKIADDAINSEHYTDGSIDNVHVATGLDAVKIADGSVTNAELQYINSLSSNAQTQISTKSPIASPTFTGTVVLPNVPAIVTTQLDLKSPLASPTFTGTPAAPTASAATNTTQLATTAFVRTEVTNLVDSAPSALDTLNELAAALGDDANFSTTVTNSIATKLPLSGGAMTGAITTNSTFDGVDIATRDGVLTSTTTTANAALPKAGGTLTGAVTVQTDSTPQITLKNASGTSYLTLSNNDIQTPSGIAMHLQTNGSTNALKLHTDQTAQFYGDVGIGVSSPDRQLHIDSGAREVALTLENDAQKFKLGVYDMDNAGDDTFFIHSHEDATDVFKINGAGKVGIGVTTFMANNKLTLTGVDADNPSILLENTATDSASRNWGIYTNRNEYGALCFMPSATKGANPYDGTASMTLLSNGNVGIGTTSPVANLEIEDGGTSNSILCKITADDASPYSLMIGNDTYSATDTNGFGINQENDGKVRFWNAGSGVMAITAAGNVGIGETSPSARLDIGVSNSSAIQYATGGWYKGLEIGYGNLATFHDSNSYQWAIGAGGSGFQIHKTTDTSGSHTNVMTISQAGNTTFTGEINSVANPPTSLGTTFNIGLNTGAGHVASIYNGNDSSSASGLQVQGGYNASTFALRLKNAYNTDLLWVGGSGNVGIGTAVPGNTLHLKSSTGSQPSINLENTNADGEPSYLYFTKTAGSGNEAAGDNIGRMIFYGTNSEDTVKSYVRIDAKAREVVENNEAGEFHIMPMSDAGGAAYNYQMLSVYGHSATGSKQAEVVVNEDSLDVDFRVESDNDTHALFVQGNDGKVGIFTSSPDYPFDVQGGSRFNGYMHYGGSGGSNDVGTISWGSGKFYIRSESGRDLSFGTNGSDGNALVLDTSQNATFAGYINTKVDTEGARLGGHDGGFEVRSTSSGSMGIYGSNSSGDIRFQLYGDGTSYGFLGTNWGDWDIKKVINGKMYLNDNSTYYLQPDSATKLYGLEVVSNFVTLGDAFIGSDGGTATARMTIVGDENQTTTGSNTDAALRLINKYGAAYGSGFEIQFMNNIAQGSNQRIAGIRSEYTHYNAGVGGDLILYTYTAPSTVVESLKLNQNAVFSGGVTATYGTFSGDVTLSNSNALRWSSDDVRIEGTTSSDNIKFFCGNTEQFKITQSSGSQFAGKLTVNGDDSHFGPSDADHRVYFGSRGTGDNGHYIRADNQNIGINAGQSSGRFKVEIAGVGKFLIDQTNIVAYQHIKPAVDNSIDLGDSGARFANLYVADAHYSNVGTGGNDVDGTEGSWTIQEGEDDLFLLNRKNGKKYKFKLEVV